MFDEIEKKWVSTGGADGPLGSSYGETMKTIDEQGKYQRFKNGSIYWDPETGAFAIHGPVMSKYSTLGYEASSLGALISDTVDLGDGRSYNDFNGGTIYCHPLFHCIVVSGPILKRWREMGAEKSVMGYPVRELVPTEDGKGECQHFQFGDIYSHPDHGIFEVRGRPRIEWYKLGGLDGKFGPPTSEVVENDDGSYQNFKHGTIIWHGRQRAVEIKEY